MAVPSDDNVLALLDQAFLMGHEAVGQKEVMQVGWVYQHPVDHEALRRFHRNLGTGLLGRRIERSALPFGRHRWVSDQEPTTLDIAEQPRPRAELGEWFDERVMLPIDPAAGPGWRLSILPLTDGGTALSLVMSHYICDGVGGVIAVTEAIMGMRRNLNYPPPRSRGRLQAVAADAARTVRDFPATTRAALAAVQEARRRRDDPRSSAPPAAAVAAAAEPVLMPAAMVHVDLGVWEAKAAELGGAGHTLAAGWTARLAERMNRGEDGSLTMQILVSDRTPEDDRAVAVQFARARVDLTGLTSDLRPIRGAVKEALAQHKAAPDDSSALAPLVPFTPQATWRKLIDWALDDPDKPVIFSNLGDVGDGVTMPDGTQAEFGYARGVNQTLTLGHLERTGGHLQVLYIRMPAMGKISLNILGYQLGAENSRMWLRELVESTLADFGVSGELD